VGDPEVLFLDEPTTGLDPVARREMWSMIEGLRLAGKTIFLTTHYMDEAQHLADRIIILRAGEIAAQGTAEKLSEALGYHTEVTFETRRGVEVRELHGALGVDVRVDGPLVSFRTQQVQADLKALLDWAQARALNSRTSKPCDRPWTTSSSVGRRWRSGHESWVTPVSPLPRRASPFEVFFAIRARSCSRSCSRHPAVALQRHLQGHDQIQRSQRRGGNVLHGFDSFVRDNARQFRFAAGARYHRARAGLLKRFRGTPMPSWVYLFSEIGRTVVVVCSTGRVARRVGTLFYHVQLSGHLLIVSLCTSS